MPVRDANAVWNGDIARGEGLMKLGSGAYEGKYSVPTRFENAAGTNPEELIGAAHAGCFSMALSAGLTKAGLKPNRIETNAKVHINKVGEGWKITLIELSTTGDVPGIDEKKFVEHAEQAKKGCPVSQALTGTEIKLQAKLG